MGDLQQPGAGVLVIEEEMPEVVGVLAGNMWLFQKYRLHDLQASMMKLNQVCVFLKEDNSLRAVGPMGGS